MSDFTNLFREDEDEDSPSLFSSLTSSPSSWNDEPQSDLQRALEGHRSGMDAAPAERGFFERLFAPFEAPQQALFKLTREIDRDGFQLSDIGSALGHGFHYAKPWSDAKPITSDEIGDLMFGDDTKKWRSLSRNLAISLLFDPLAVAPLTRIAKLSGPGTRVGDALAVFRQKTGSTLSGAFKRAAKTGGEFVLGEEKFSRLSSAVGQGLISRYWGVPDEFRSRFEAYEAGVQSWRREAADILKDAEALRGGEAHRLMADALESEAFFMASRGSDAAQHVRSFEATLNKAKDLGVNEDDFLRIYTRARELDTRIGEGLARVGVLDMKSPEFQGMRNTHLRRMFMAYERPRDYFDRVEALDIPDMEKLSTSKLKKNLTALRDTLDAKLYALPEGSPAGTQRLFGVNEGMGMVSDEAGLESAKAALEKLLRKRYSTPFDAPINDWLDSGELVGRGIQAHHRLQSAAPDLQHAWTALKADMHKELRTTPQFASEASYRATLEGVASRSDDWAKEAMKRGDANAMSAFKTLANDARASLGVSRGSEAARAARRYFTESDGRERFNVGRFVDDLDAYLMRNSDASMDDVLAHVKTEMLGSAALPSELSEAITEHILGSTFTVKGSKHYANRLQKLMMEPGISFRSFREQLEKVQARKDMPKELREALGEIEEFGPRLAGEATEAGGVLELRKFLDDVAGIERDEFGKVVSKGSRLLSDDPSAFGKSAVQITTKEFGEDIQGMYTTPSVARLLNRLETAARPSGPVDKMAHATMEALKNATAQFKLFKVLLDPTAHARNLLGNSVLATISGISPVAQGSNLPKALNELLTMKRTGEMGEYLTLANRVGSTMFLDTFSKRELGVMADRLGRVRKSYRNMQDVSEGLKAVFKEGNALQEGAEKLFDKVGAAYQFNEEMFKLTSFIARYDETLSNLARRGKPIDEATKLSVAESAADFANKALFDYGDVPLLVEFARKYGVMPFITFPWKATGRTAEALLTRPHTVLAIPRMTNTINNEFGGGPERVRREIASLPQWARQNLVVKVPWRDGFDREQFLDLSYFLPWYAIRDMSKSVTQLVNPDGAGPLSPDSFFGSSPILGVLHAFQTGKDSLDRPIYESGDDAATKAKKMGHFLYQTLAPPILPSGSRSESIGKAMLAMASASNEPMPMTRGVGNFLTVLNPDRGELGLDSNLRPPTNQANLTGTDGEMSFLDVLKGLPATGAGLNTLGSDPVKAAAQESGRASASLTELQKQRSAIARNPNLSKEEKVRAMLKLQKRINEVKLEKGANLEAMFR